MWRRVGEGGGGGGVEAVLEGGAYRIWVFLHIQNNCDMP